MLNTILCKKFLKWFVAKMRALITNYCFRHSKSREDVFFEELEYHHVIICLASTGFHPFGDRIHNHKDMGHVKFGMAP